MRAERARLSRGDLALDAYRTIRSKPGRALALGLAIILGVAAFIGICSMSASANRRTAERIDALRPELVRVSPTTGAPGAIGGTPTVTARELHALAQVEAAAVADTYETSPVQARIASAPVGSTVIGAEGDLVGSTRSTIEGQSIAHQDVLPGAHVAVVGAAVADRLAIGTISSAPTIWVSGVPFTVIGVVTDSTYLADLIDAIVIPRSTAHDLASTDFISTTAYVRTERGAAAAVGDIIPLHLSPQAPEAWSVAVPRVPIDVSEGISADLRSLTIALSVLVMAIGMVAIANAMMRSVYERTPEIGLRRSLGARGAHIVAMVVLEAGIIGLAAGIIGVIVGSAAALVVASRNGWPAVISTPTLGPAVAAATLAGVLAGLVPGIRAVQVTPSEALRRD